MSVEHVLISIEKMIVQEKDCHMFCQVKDSLGAKKEAVLSQLVQSKPFIQSDMTIVHCCKLLR